MELASHRSGHAVWSVTLVAVLICTVLGGARVASAFRGQPGPASLLAGGISYTVTHVELVQGLSDADLGGMAHGVQSLVTDDKALVSVSLVVAAGGAARSYDANVLRATAAGSKTSLAPVGGTFVPGRLQAHARVEGSLSFVVPRNGAQLVLGLPGKARTVPLLQAPTASGGALEHHHMSTPLGTTAPARPQRPAGRKSP